MKTPESIDSLGYQKWQQGLCHIYAQALRDHLAKGQLACLWIDRGFAHIYLCIEGLAYDSEHCGILESEMIEIWKRKMPPKWSIELEKRLDIREFVPLGLRLGDGPLADAYDGPERERWYNEAKSIIESDLRYRLQRR